MAARKTNRPAVKQLLFWLVVLFIAPVLLVLHRSHDRDAWPSWLQASSTTCWQATEL